ncbi:MAG: molybdopterin-dependent oxidoreductase [Caldilineaceae bacterium]|nr:molybdopterin-dependent oxidoreductase [Caldilineaceae bacterium]
MSNPLKDMEKPDVIFCIGTNMTECHPVAATRLKKALARGAKLIVADPRRIRLAEMADIYLPLRVGSDTALLLAMAHVIAREELLDEEFVAKRTTGVVDFLEHVKQFTPAWAETISGVRAADIEAAALLYGRAERGCGLLHPGHHRAYLRGGQCAEPLQPGLDDGQYRSRRHGHQPHARSEQHPGRWRQRRVAQQLCRFPGGG